MLHRRQRPPQRLRIVRPTSEPGAPPPLATPEDRGARARWAASLGGSLVLHALALAALAWGAATLVRVAEREDPPPVFVTLLEGTPADDAAAESGAVAGETAEEGARVEAPPPARATEPQAADVGPAPPERDRSRARTAPPAPSPPRPRDEPRADRAPREPAATAADAPPAPDATAGAAGATAGAETTLAARTPATPGAGDADRVYGEGEVDRIAAPLGGIRRPEYPARERMLGREGRVSLVVTVDAGGAVRDVRVARSAGEAFDVSARRAVERTPFRAARVADRAVTSTVTVDVSFELD